MLFLIFTAFCYVHNQILLWKRNNSNNNSFHCQHFVEKENYTKHNILALYSQYNSTINEIKERYKQGTWAEVESLMLTVDTCLTISSTSRRPGRQFTQLFSDVDAAFATCLSNHSVSTSSPSTISEQLLSSTCITLRLQGQKVHKPHQASINIRKRQDNEKDRWIDTRPLLSVFCYRCSRSGKCKILRQAKKTRSKIAEKLRFDDHETKMLCTVKRQLKISYNNHKDRE